MEAKTFLSLLGSFPADKNSFIAGNVNCVPPDLLKLGVEEGVLLLLKVVTKHDRKERAALLLVIATGVEITIYVLVDT